MFDYERGHLPPPIAQAIRVRCRSRPKPATVPVPAQAALAAPASPGAPAAASVEASLAHKQKLDCALQLARSVALDFNNALTSILGHASLLLSKAEAGHPWRNSLGEIEKSAAKAAEIATTWHPSAGRRRKPARSRPQSEHAGGTDG